MKTLIITIFVLVSLTGYSQKLNEIYKKDKINLFADESYALGNNWDKVFESYYDTIYKKPMGERKRLHILPDGSAIVDHRYRNFFTKFDANGKFVKEFKVRKNGKALKKVYQIKGILDNSIIYTDADNMGNIICFDFDGNYLKTLNLDYSVKQTVSLPNRKIAVKGWSIWAKKIRNFVVIVDYETNEEELVWEQFTDRNECGSKPMFNYCYVFDKQGMMGFNSMPLSNSIGMRTSPIIDFVNSNLIIALPDKGEIRKYNLNGDFVGLDKVDWSNNVLSVEEQKEIQKKAIEVWKKNAQNELTLSSGAEETKRATAEILSSMEQDLNAIKSPIIKPYFSTILKDSDDNLLFFEYPETSGQNKFNVYTYSDGQFVNKSTFESADYNLVINPSKMVFKDGYLYSIQTLKAATGVPLRLVRFKLN